MRQKNVSTCLLLAAVLSAPGVSAQQQHAVFGKRILADPRMPDVVRLYLDHTGAIYPPGAVPIRDERLRSHGMLLKYFSESPAEWAALQAHTRTRGLRVQTVWSQAQDSLRAGFVRGLNQLLLDGGPHTLVVLVHGFNVRDAETTYQMVRETIRGRYFRNRRAVFLLVNWDGMWVDQSFRGAVHIPEIWHDARYHAPLVGMELRRVLAAVDPQVPVRVISHSLGGSVVTSSFWNRPAEFGAIFRPSYANYDANSRGQPPYVFPEHPDMRIGMIVPAIPGSAFARARTTRRTSGNYPLLLIGQNAQDRVVNKSIFPSSAFGSTTLAVHRAQFCRYVYPVFSADPAAAAYRIDFSQPEDGVKEHDFEVYMQRTPMRQFLDLLFGTAAPEVDERAQCEEKRAQAKRPSSRTH